MAPNLRKGKIRMNVTVDIMQGSKLTADLPIPPSLSVLEGSATPPKGKSVFRIINQKDGDKRIVWDAGSMVEINGAKEMFDNLISEGLVPYRVDVSGKRTPEVMQEFDPAAEEVIFMPIAPVAGG